MSEAADVESLVLPAQTFSLLSPSVSFCATLSVTSASELLSSGCSTADADGDDDVTVEEAVVGPVSSRSSFPCLASGKG